MTHITDTDSRLRRYGSLADMIGDPDNPTPMVALSRVVPDGGADVLVKMEWLNPFGSVKDRAAKWMLQGLANRGELGERTVLEPTSGNTGIALAAMANLLGNKMIATVPYNTPEEKLVLLKALGALVVPTPEDCTTERHPMDVAIDIAFAMLKEAPDEFVIPNQYDNPDNSQAHYETTGPEIWRQTEGRVDYFFAGYGTCGTLMGVGRYLKEQNPDVKVVAIEPVMGHHISGLKNLTETSVPGLLDPSLIDEVIAVDDAETEATLLRVHAEESLLMGPTAAAILSGALRYLRGREGVAVTIAPDSSMKAMGYLASALDR